MVKSWTAVLVTIPAAAAEPLGAFLLDVGSPGLLTEDIGDTVVITAYFADRAPIAHIRNYCDRLEQLFPGASSATIEQRAVKEQEWADNWRSHFPPLWVGKRLFIHPPWIREIPPGRIGVEIEPGMAFGTGQHPSTRGCLVLLEQLFPATPHAVVVDLGTGSGILAITAALLGAGRAWAVDVDPEARRIAQRNATLNRVDTIVRVCDSLEQVREPCDLLMANLFAGQLIELAPRIAASLRQGGVAIGAGILRGEEEAVGSAWADAGLGFVARLEEQGWVALAYRTPRAPEG